MSSSSSSGGFGAFSQTANPWTDSGFLEVAVASRKRPPVSLGSSQEDGVAALLPKMKRMRLKPSFGQLRLQREAEDTDSLPPEIKLVVEPEQLRALITIEIAIGKYSSADVGGTDLVYLELSFPPQYPHRPPKICQVSPQSFLPFWRYEGPYILLERLTERAWSPAMGISDILKDVLRPLSWEGLGGDKVPLSHDPDSPTLGDVEMV
jgi:ubiquitin-protein ligase